jgi:hypothetical protein
MFTRPSFGRVQAAGKPGGFLILIGVLRRKSLLIGGIAIDVGSASTTADDGTKHPKFIKAGP